MEANICSVIANLNQNANEIVLDYVDCHIEREEFCCTPVAA